MSDYIVKVRDYSTLWPWILDTDYDSLDAALQAIGSSNKTLLVTKEHTLTQNTTIPSNVELNFLRGGKITLGDYDLTINGPMKDVLHQVFVESGVGSVTFGSGAVDVVRPEWFSDSDIGDQLTKAIASISSDYMYIKVAPGSYTLTTPVDVTDLGANRNITIDLGRARIILKTDGKPAFDCTGSGDVKFKGGWLEGSSSDTPSSAILSATTSSVTGQLILTIDDTIIKGHFTKAAVIGVCTAYLQISNSTKVQNEDGIALSVTRRNARSEASVYSTISTLEDNISVWATDRVTFRGGTSGGLPVVELAGTTNHIEFRGSFMYSLGGPFFTFDISNDNMSAIYIDNIRGEVSSEYADAILISGTNSITMHVSGGRLPASSNLVKCDSGNFSGEINFPSTISRGTGGNVTLHDVGLLFIDMNGLGNLSVDGSIAGAINAYGYDSDIPKILLTGTNTTRCNFVGMRGSNQHTFVLAELSANQSVSGSDEDVIAFADEQGDWFGEYDNTTYTFTATRKGLYLVEASALVTPGSADDIIELAIQKNSSDWVKFKRSCHDTGTNETLHTSAVLYLAASDTVRATIKNVSGHGLTIIDADAYTWFRVTRLGLRLPQ